MRVYLSKSGLAAALGKHINHLIDNNPPTPDLLIGPWQGWLSSRVHDGGIAARHSAPRRLLGVAQVAAMLGISRQAVRKLRDNPSPYAIPFPAPVARIESGGGARAQRPHGGGWNGHVYGWREQDITAFAWGTGRVGDGHKGNRGRRPGTGNYADLPRCLRPRDASRHGNGRPCQAVRRKIAGVWAPACGIHLTGEERATLNI